MYCGIGWVNRWWPAMSNSGSAELTVSNFCWKEADCGLTEYLAGPSHLEAVDDDHGHGGLTTMAVSYTAFLGPMVGGQPCPTLVVLH